MSDPAPTPAPLDAGAIVDGISPGVRALISDVVVVDETRSTNEDLLGLSPAQRHGRVVLAERQTAGRGRRGRPWQSPAGNIWMSVGWRFAAAPRDLGDLSLVAGVCVCRALARNGLEGQRIKRPNDILVNGMKLCGILVETRIGRSGCDSVSGIGVNVRMPDGTGERIDQPWTDLHRLLGDQMPARNSMIVHLLDELVPRFNDEPGMAAFLADAWPSWALSGNPA